MADEIAGATPSTPAAGETPPPASTPPAAETPPAATPPSTPGANGDASEVPARTGDFPDDWRERMAGEDTKFLGQLKRFSSPTTFAKSWLAKETLITSGAVKQPFPDNGTEAEVAKWRQENDVPNAPTDYGITPPEGDEADAPLIEAALTRMQQANMPKAQAKVAIAAYYDVAKLNKQRVAELDAAHMAEAEDALRADLGGSYRTTMNGVRNLFAANGDPELYDLVREARARDGRLLGNHPQFWKMMSALATDVNPVPAITGVDGQTSSTTVEAQLAELNEMQLKDPVKFYSDEVQKRQRTLYEVQERLRARR